MRPRNQALAEQLTEKLQAFSEDHTPLPGIQLPKCCQSFVEQIIESIRRVNFVSVIRERDIDPRRANPTSNLFDPLRAAILCQNEASFDEAFWLVFLSVHFGKHHRDGWRLARDIYCGIGGDSRWNWQHVSEDPNRFRQWLTAAECTLKNDGVTRRFGNHRKYESLSGSSAQGTGAVVESYANWIEAYVNHEGLIEHTRQQVGTNPRAMFDYLFYSMNAVVRFGRTAKFDYLTMLGKLGLAPIEPGSTYMAGATGPLTGARLLFGGSKQSTLKHKKLDAMLVELDIKLDVGMQVLEDALCNWQKSPEAFTPFRG